MTRSSWRPSSPLSRPGASPGGRPAVGIQQPTVSQHISRLERQVGRTLVQRDTHSVALTADGEAMVGFARNILGAGEQAAAYFSGSRPSGRLRIGISGRPRAYPAAADPARLPPDNPLVDFDLTVDQSGLLHQRLEATGSTCSSATGRRGGEQRGQLVKRTGLVWVGTPSTRLDLTRPLRSSSTRREHLPVPRCAAR